MLAVLNKECLPNTVNCFIDQTSLPSAETCVRTLTTAPRFHQKTPTRPVNTHQRGRKGLSKVKTVVFLKPSSRSSIGQPIPSTAMEDRTNRLQRNTELIGIRTMQWWIHTTSGTLLLQRLRKQWPRRAAMQGVSCVSLSVSDGVLVPNVPLAKWCCAERCRVVPIDSVVLQDIVLLLC